MINAETQLAVDTVSAKLAKEVHGLHMRMSRYKIRIVALERQVTALEEIITSPANGGPA